MSRYTINLEEEGSCYNIRRCSTMVFVGFLRMYHSYSIVKNWWYTINNYEEQEGRSCLQQQCDPKNWKKLDDMYSMYVTSYFFRNISRNVLFSEISRTFQFRAQVVWVKFSRLRWLPAYPESEKNWDLIRFIEILESIISNLFKIWRFLLNRKLFN